MIDRRVRVLQALALHGTVTATAEALNYTPSAISAQLRALATAVGVPLLEPDGRGVRITAAGRVLLAGADGLLADWEELHTAMLRASEAHGGALRMCGFSAAAATLLPWVTARLRIDHPNLSVTVVEATPEDCFRQLHTGRADVAVVMVTADTPSLDDPRYEQESLMVDPLDLLLPVGHRLDHGGPLKFSDTATENWIVDRPGTAYHGLFLNSCLAAGFMPTIAHHASEWDTGAALVSVGLGVALVPRLAHLPEGYDIRRVPLTGDPTPRRHVVAAVRRGTLTNPTVETALSALRVRADELCRTHTP